MDIASMACSLEARSPFLDHRLIEFCAALPSTVKTDGRARKIVQREALRGLSPGAILDRPKQGFSIPLRAWLRGPLAPWPANCWWISRGGYRNFSMSPQSDGCSRRM
jgi:asparagine synthase (glutamine-hydrolysing)